MNLPSGIEFGWICFGALAAAGFASIVARRVRLALVSRRSGQRLEFVRSVAMAALMSFCAFAAAYGTITRIISIALQ